MIRPILIAALTGLLLTPAMAGSKSPKKCPTDNTILSVDVNWSNAFPIMIGGVTTPGPRNPPQPSKMKEPAVCICPERGAAAVGIGLTYWVPEFLAEVQDKAGCLPSFGADMEATTVAGAKATDSQGPADLSGSGDNDDKTNEARRMQVHWFKYPLFAMLDLFNSLACANTSGTFAIADLTEVNPTWHDDFWANITNPESFLYANPVALAACTADAVASSAHLPLDVMNWCVGAQGGLYPISGKSGHSEYTSPADGNLAILAKYMQWLSRSFRLQVTIGPMALCRSVVFPNLLKSQYRIDPLKPVHTNSFVRFGKYHKLWDSFPPLNPGERYDTTFLIWQGQQCCVL